MRDSQRSSWLAQRIGLVAIGMTLIAVIVEYRPSTSELPWRTYAEGLEEARATGKPLFVDLYATWCGPCKQMERTTFRNDSVRSSLTRSYIPVRIDIDTDQYDDTLKVQWNLKGVPTSMIVAANGSILGRRTGFQNARDLLAWLSDSSLLAYAGWLDYESARSRSTLNRKPLLVVVTRQVTNLDEIQQFFLHPRFRDFLQEHFVVTRIAGEGTVELAQFADLDRLYSLSLPPRDGMLMLALAPDGAELGRIPVRAEELEDHERIMDVLRRYFEAWERVSGGIPPGTPASGI